MFSFSSDRSVPPLIAGAKNFQEHPELYAVKYVHTVVQFQKEQNPDVDVVAWHSDGTMESAGNASQPRFCSDALFASLTAHAPRERYVNHLKAPAGSDEDITKAFKLADKQYAELKAAVYDSLPPAMRKVYDTSNDPPPSVAKMLDDILGWYQDRDADPALQALIEAELSPNAIVPAAFEEYERLVERLSPPKRTAQQIPDTMIASFIAKLPTSEIKSAIAGLVTKEMPLRRTRTWQEFKAKLMPHIEGALESLTTTAHIRAAVGASFCHACDAAHDPHACPIVLRIVREESKFNDKLLKNQPGPTDKIAVSFGQPPNTQWDMKLSPGWGRDYRIRKPANDRADFGGRGGDSRGGTTNGRGGGIDKRGDHRGGAGRGNNGNSGRFGGGRGEGHARFADAAGSADTELDGPATKTSAT
jgi:hypothetical protein